MYMYIYTSLHPYTHKHTRTTHTHTREADPARISAAVSILFFGKHTKIGYTII